MHRGGKHCALGALFPMHDTISSVLERSASDREIAKVIDVLAGVICEVEPKYTKWGGVSAIYQRNDDSRTVEPVLTAFDAAINRLEKVETL